MPNVAVLIRNLQPTEKARELWRKQRREKALIALGDLQWQVSAEFGRQRSAGFVMKPRTEINNIEMEPFRLWEPGSPKEDCSICRLVHGDEIQHVCE